MLRRAVSGTLAHIVVMSQTVSAELEGAQEWVATEFHPVQGRTSQRCPG